MILDPAIEAFVADSERFYPAGAATLPMAEQRRLYDAYAAAFAVARPAEVRSRDAVVTTQGRSIPVRRYVPGTADPHGTIVFAHGGGFVLGSLGSHDGIAARLAAGTGAIVVAVDYRLAPEQRAPAARDDVLAVIEAVLAGATPWPDLPRAPLALCGDSAGGTLVASAALVLRPEAGAAPLAALALVYPMLGREPQGPARDTEAHAPMLTLADVRAYRDHYLGGREPDASTFVLDAPWLGGLPPTLLIAAEHDPLRDDCTRLFDRLGQAGVAAECLVGPGLVHGFLRAIDRSAAAATAFDRLTGFLRARLSAS